MTVTTRHRVATHGQGDVHDLTATVADAVQRSGVRAGLVTVSVIGSTAGITTMEFEPGACADLAALFERLAPRHADYRHHLTWGDDNGSSHARASVVGPSLSVPLEAGQPLLGTWQQIVLLEFDTRSRTREIVIQVMGGK
jgi:secondary thiamine-phosphate synthase enzyme